MGFFLVFLDGGRYRYAAQLMQDIKYIPDGADKLALRTTYSDILRVVWIVIAAIASVALGLSVVIKG